MPHPPISTEDAGSDDQWVDVTKTIAKRRFLENGVEAAVDPVRSPARFCDVELAAIAIDGVSWWSMALAAYGAPATSLTVMRAAWDTVAAAPLPSETSSAFGEPRGYPGWLADRFPRATGVSMPDIAAAS